MHPKLTSMAGPPAEHMAPGTPATAGDEPLSGALTRRRLLQDGASIATGAAMVIASAPLLSCRDETNAPPQGHRASLAERILQLVGVPAAVAPIGRQYLALTPEESSGEALVSKLTAGWSPLQRELPTSELHAVLRAQQVKDFATGRTVRVAGWTLSLTEARVAALAVALPLPHAS